MIWITRDGYVDQAAAVVADLRAAGRGDVVAENAEFVCVRLDPSDQPKLPPPLPVEVPVPLTPGANRIRFATDVPGELPANGDPRLLAFSVRNFRVRD